MDRDGPTLLAQRLAWIRLGYQFRDGRPIEERSIMAIPSSRRLCNEQSCLRCAATKSGHRVIRLSGSTALITVSTVNRQNNVRIPAPSIRRRRR